MKSGKFTKDSVFARVEERLEEFAKKQDKSAKKKTANGNGDQNGNGDSDGEEKSKKKRGGRR